MANTLQRMERDSLIRREPDPADGRRTRVRLITRARTLEGPLAAAAREVNADATRGLSEQEAAAFMHTMARVIGNLEAAADNRPSPKAGALSDRTARAQPRQAPRVSAEGRAGL